jgi:aryl-alcohol dehydrogenase (NADP+)
MEYVRLGSTGLEVSRLVLGCMSFADPKRGPHPWTLDEESSRPLIRQAVEVGINFFDTANVYSAGSSEEIAGKTLKDFGRRDELVIATDAISALDLVLTDAAREQLESAYEAHHPARF